MTKEKTLNTASLSPATPPRKPRLAFMGEFSAGKSTLSKLFLGNAPLPVQVTATRLPPIWISYGDEAAIAVDRDGTEREIDIEDLEAICVDETRMIRLYNRSETLEICDLIDMPGISDPSMSSDVWLSMIEHVDSVVWCTQATQAWRQSEAAAWELIRDRTNGDNILLVTQVDKLRVDRDVDRVINRVRKETEGLFKAVYPISIIEALNAGDDFQKWQESGAAEFVDHLVELLLNASEEGRSAPVASQETTKSSQGQDLPDSAASGAPQEMAGTSLAEASPSAQNAFAEPVVYKSNSVIPKRVRVLTEMRGRTARPSPSVDANW